MWSSLCTSAHPTVLSLFNPALNLTFSLLPITSSHPHASASDSTFDLWCYVNVWLTLALCVVCREVRSMSGRSVVWSRRCRRARRCLKDSQRPTNSTSSSSASVRAAHLRYTVYQNIFFKNVKNRRPFNFFMTDLAYSVSLKSSPRQWEALQQDGRHKMSPISNFLPPPNGSVISDHWLTQNAPNLTYKDLGFKTFSNFFQGNLGLACLHQFILYCTI